ncbi:MAG: nagZ [Deltaproteobacteria bacterium]|nr:nagZ [Deltaproteobacteria bacterium]
MSHHDTRVTAAEIGGLFLVGIPGPQLDPDTQRLLERIHIGGVVLFRRNVDSPAQIARLTAALHALPSAPLVAIDHEGGRVLRLGEPFTQFPPVARVGHSGDANLAFRVGQAMAEELRSVGIDLNFAPVLDVDSNPANPIIGDRAFSSDPAVVSQCGIAMMRGLLAGGVIPCGKHFPGHGDTVADSHLELPVVRRSRAELERTELVPFRAAIAAGIPMLMTAHVVYPALDPTRPATVSPAVLTDLLRTELCFDGVIVSDDLEMRAIADHHAIGAAAVATLQAGADALLVCQDLHQAERAVQAVAQRIADGALPTATVRAAVARLERLRQRRPPGQPAACALPSAAHRALAQSC